MIICLEIFEKKNERTRSSMFSVTFRPSPIPQLGLQIYRKSWIHTFSSNQNFWHSKLIFSFFSSKPLILSIRKEYSRDKESLEICLL